MPPADPLRHPGARPPRRRRDAIARHALTAWAVLTLALGAVRAPRFRAELDSLLTRPPMCAAEADFAALGDALSARTAVILVTDRTPEESVETMFCAQHALAPRPLVRRFAVHFDPTVAPETALLLDIRDESTRLRVVASRSDAARRAGLTPEASRHAGEVVLMTAEAIAR